MSSTCPSNFLATVVVVIDEHSDFGLFGGVGRWETTRDDDDDDLRRVTTRPRAAVNHRRGRRFGNVARVAAAHAAAMNGILAAWPSAR